MAACFTRDLRSFLQRSLAGNQIEASETLAKVRWATELYSWVCRQAFTCHAWLGLAVCHWCMGVVAVILQILMGVCRVGGMVVQNVSIVCWLQD